MPRGKPKIRDLTLVVTMTFDANKHTRAGLAEVARKLLLPLDLDEDFDVRALTDEDTRRLDEDEG